MQRPIKPTLTPLEFCSDDAHSIRCEPAQHRRRAPSECITLPFFDDHMLINSQANEMGTGPIALRVRFFPNDEI